MDRRVVLAIVLMMVIAIVPATFLAPPAPPAAGVDSIPAVPTVPQPLPPPESPDLLAPPLPADTVRVSSSLYSYGISTRGGGLVEAHMRRYRSLAEGDTTDVQLFPDDGHFLRLAVATGRDTIPLHQFSLRSSARAITVEGPSIVTLTGSRDGIDVALTYTFAPDTYRIGVALRVGGLGPNGGVLLVGMGPTIRNTEADSVEHTRNLGVVTKQSDTELLRFGSLDPGESRILTGPFEWVAVKSKYFVTAVLAFDQAAAGTGGRIGGVQVVARDKPTAADIVLTHSVSGAGEANFEVYAGPMEYDRLRAVGHDFDDVNPYGWPGFRTLIRPVAVGARWLLVWMHETLFLSYGMVLVAFGVMIRLLLWPLNQKAMRSAMQMQAIQPQMKEVQERHKKDPQKAQQEMFKLYKEHGVNPMGGCWPMLLPMPVLLALFFVLQNTIELRGAPFLWIADLSRHDPLYVIPLVMGISMFAVSKIGQIGLPPTPQTKMMVYVMPVMMTFFFFRFASGLNLYYAVQNIASIPQQWMLSRERLKRMPPAPPPKPPAQAAKKRPAR